MNKIIRVLKTFPGVRIEIKGQAGSTGDDMTNQVLSVARAEKVAKSLIEVGEVASDQITSRGFGETRPVATNEPREGRAKNRMGEIKTVNE